MKASRPRKRSVSHVDTAGVLEDPRGFFVNQPELPSYRTAVVGRNLSGALIYVEYVLNRGDQAEIELARPASAEQQSFYDSQG